MKKIKGTTSMPRLKIHVSNRYVYAQIIDDEKGITIIGASGKELASKSKKMEAAKELGMLIAKKAQEKKVKKVVFDRGGKAYHGNVKALAEGAREGGLQF